MPPRFPMRLALALSLAVTLCVGVAVTPGLAAETPAPWSRQFDPARDPAADLREALAIATVQGKRVLVDVGGDWCIWCKLLDATFESQADLAGLREAHFVTLKVHYDRKVNQNQAFLSQYPKINGYPHLFVLDADGTLLHSQNTGDLELPPDQGKGHDVTRIRAFLTQWAGPAAG